MATHQASINIQKPTKFKLEATRIRVEYSFHLELDKLLNPSAIRKPSSTNSSKNSPSSRNSNQNPQQPDLKSTDLNHGGFYSSDEKLCNRWCGNLRPEGNIRPNPLVFLQLTKLPKLKLWNMTPYAYFWISELQVSYILPPHPSNQKSFCLGPQTHENPIDLISCEANRIPFVSQDINLNLWADCLRARLIHLKAG